MTFDSNVKTYLKAYQNEYRASIRGGQHTDELSFRVPMHELFQKIAYDLNSAGHCKVILEPKNQGRVGRPDWLIHDSISMGIYGYIEAKGPSNEPFDTTPYRDQISRYLTLGHKLIITDGIDFVFCFTASPVLISLIDKSRMNVADWSRLPINQQFGYYMEQFFSTPVPQRIDEDKLIELVAVRTRILADDIQSFADLSLDEARDDNERHIIELLSGLKNIIYNHNDPHLRTGSVFADFTAQVIMFCLLYAHRVRCTSEASPTEKADTIRAFAFNDITKEAALLPFRDLMLYLHDNSGTDTFIGQWVDECISFLSFAHMTNEQLQSPDFHHLFELFLNKFDKQARFDYGAFYTPKILAKFIVRLVNKIVGDSFDGATIYDDGNTIIDPCCGTGSFLEQIVAHDPSDGEYNLCGFEIMPAPYMLANYRMALVERQYSRKNLKPNIILANTLSNYLLSADADERSIEGRELIRAKELSSRPLKLIIGNPPSSDSKRSNISANFSDINGLMDDFRPPVENRRGRQNIQKQINNPYMQFLRWSCKKLLSNSTHSVLAFIVPLSFLENESFKYARKYLVEHFSSIWAITIDADAHTGIRSDSLFKTMQGRAIIILTKKAGIDAVVTEIKFVDYSRVSRAEKQAILEGSIENVMADFTTFPVCDAMYSFMPTHPFNEKLYAKFWPISTETGNPGVFLNQCSGAKMAPTALLTHVKRPMLKRRSREIAADGVPKAQEWIGGQDKHVVDSKITAFQNALNTCTSKQSLESTLNDNIRLCSFRPFVNSNALLWGTIFDYQAGVGGGGARVRPEIKAIYDLSETVGFSLAHAPKDLDESLGQFTSFCWYFPDNDLSRRGNGHIYLNHYIRDPRSGVVMNNVHSALIEHLSVSTGLSAQEIARKVVFYSYAIFCSQVYLEEFYGALFVVNQSESRARIPIVDDAKVFLQLASLGENLAVLEKNDAKVKNVLGLDYEGLLAQLPPGFHLEHSRSATKNPYDEENEEFIIRDTVSGSTIRIYCPIPLQKFTVAGYNVIKDCWVKFHSYRFTHCDFTRDDLKELLDLFNKIASQMQIVSEIDVVMHEIVRGDVPLLNYG